ncbi:helix-turn-helix domain-containing protein [Lewinella sp. LCG006]|uniref:helix-turn-helix domain-containing protein n=1 Tax=Lewinella sp. LCG006 TaxID=3231911 RepID=UPI0034617A61
MQLSISNLTILLGVLQGIVLGFIFLVSPYFRSQANRFLSYTFWTTAILGANYSIVMSGIQNNWFTLVYDIMWEYLFPTTLLLYFAYALDHPLAKSAKQYWLYLPFTLTLLINVIIDLDVDFHLYHFSLLHNDPLIQSYYLFEDAGTVIFAVFTFSWSWQMIKKYPPKFATSWFREFWWWSTGVMLLWIGLWLCYEAAQKDYEGYIFAAVSILFFWVTYRGVLQFKLAEEKFEIRKILSTYLQDQTNDSSATTETTPPQNLYFHRLEQLMQKDHLYRDPQLNRDMVAKKLGISSGYLSQQLSACCGSNFSEYTNQYRVEEVKRLLLDPTFSTYSLLAIGYQAGFNSKSTFYATFKKTTGLSPSAYQKQFKDLSSSQASGN